MVVISLQESIQHTKIQALVTFFHLKSAFVLVRFFTHSRWWHTFGVWSIILRVKQDLAQHYCFGLFLRLDRITIFSVFLFLPLISYMLDLTSARLITQYYSVRCLMLA